MTNEGLCCLVNPIGLTCAICGRSFCHECHENAAQIVQRARLITGEETIGLHQAHSPPYA